MEPDMGANASPQTPAERALATRLAAAPQQMVFGDNEPAAIVDRYYTPDFEQDHDGIRFDHERLIQHTRPASPGWTPVLAASRRQQPASALYLAYARARAAGATLTASQTRELLDRS